MRLVTTGQATDVICDAADTVAAATVSFRPAWTAAQSELLRFEVRPIESADRRRAVSSFPSVCATVQLKNFLKVRVGHDSLKALDESAIAVHVRLLLSSQPSSNMS
jgi:hypothetical protein